LSCYTGVGAVLSVSHYDDKGRLHGHSYEVIAWFLDSGSDALDLQRQLIAACAEYDHTVLPEGLARAEALGSKIKTRIMACEVEVNRPLERLYARAE